MGKGHSTVRRGMFPTVPLCWVPGIFSSTSRLPEPVMPRGHSQHWGTQLATGPAPHPRLRDTSQSEPTAERPQGPSVGKLSS